MSIVGHGKRRRKVFEYGETVRVTPKGRRSFKGTVYNEYEKPPGRRFICINTPSGCGIAFPLREVHKLK
jgi:hypothetical protein